MLPSSWKAETSSPVSSTVLSIILIALALVATTVTMHAAGLAVVLKAVVRPQAQRPMRFLPMTWLLIRVTWWLILIHAAEITVWALCYVLLKCHPDAESAFYFSGVTYATVGYGDLVLPKPWRMLGPIQGLTGILMCGLSTGFFLALVSKLYASQRQTKTSRGQ